MSCERCAELERLLHQAEDNLAELGRQVAGLEHNLRRAGSAEMALRQELNRVREEEPDSPTIRRLIELWRELHRGGDKRIQIKLSGDRAKLVKKALRLRGEERVEHAIRGALLHHWTMGRHPDGSPRNDLKWILRDEDNLDKFAEMFERPPEPTGVQALLGKLEGVRQARDGQWEALCPAHDDHNRSLSVGQGHKGALVHCHTGCTVGQIADAVGIPLGVLFDPEAAPPVPAPKVQPDPLPSPAQLEAWRRRLLAHDRLLERLAETRGWTPDALDRLGVGWDDRTKRLTLPVYDPDGLVNVVRYVPGGKPKTLALRGRPRGLFPAPETIAGDEVWLVEGESDAVSGTQLGLPAVGLPGTNGWRDTWAQRLKGRRVVVCLDCDDPGRQAAARVARSLVGHAREVRVVDLDPSRHDGYDMSDLLLEGGTERVVRDLAALTGALVAINGKEAA